MDVKSKEKKPGLIGVLIVLIFLMVALTSQIFILKSDWTTHITLIFATVVATIVALFYGFTFSFEYIKYALFKTRKDNPRLILITDENEERTIELKKFFTISKY